MTDLKANANLEKQSSSNIRKNYSVPKPQSKF